LNALSHSFGYIHNHNTSRPPTFQLVTPPDKLFTFLIYNRQKTPPTLAYSQNLPTLIWIQP